MKKIIFFLIFFISGLAYAEMNLPKCKGENFKNWTDCYGIQKIDIYHYEGQWKNGKKNGNGQLYFLASILLISLMVSPFVSAIALKASLD